MHIVNASLATAFAALATAQVLPLKEADRRAIATLKSTSASEIEAALPTKPFAEWLAGAVGREVQLRWLHGDCAMAPGKMRREDRPRCVRVDVLGGSRPGPWQSLQIQVQVEKGDKPLRPPCLVQILRFNTDGTIETPDTLAEVFGVQKPTK